MNDFVGDFDMVMFFYKGMMVEFFVFFVSDGKYVVDFGSFIK